MGESEVASVAEVGADLARVLERSRSQSTFAFSFGDGRPEAVMLTYDQFSDSDGESRFDRHPGVVPVEVVAENLEQMMVEVRAGTHQPVVWGADGEPEAMIMSTAQYRDLRGDDHPPPGIDDDPTQRSYETEALPDSRPMSMDQIAEMMGPESVDLLQQIREEEGDRSE